MQLYCTRFKREAYLWRILLFVRCTLFKSESKLSRNVCIDLCKQKSCPSFIKEVYEESNRSSAIFVKLPNWTNANVIYVRIEMIKLILFWYLSEDVWFILRFFLLIRFWVKFLFSFLNVLCMFLVIHLDALFYFISKSINSLANCVCIRNTQISSYNIALGKHFVDLYLTSHLRWIKIWSG